MTTGQTIRPDAVTVEERVRQWTVVRDCLEGDMRIKQRGDTYLPRPSGMREDQEDAQYKAYKARAEFFGVAERTLRGLTGMVFRIEPTFTVPDGLTKRLEGVTPEGLSIQTLARAVVRAQLSVGRYGLLPDLPREAPPGTLPYLAPFSAENIVDWEEEVTDGRRQVVRIDLRMDDKKTPTAEEKQQKATEKILRLVLEDGVYKQRRFERAIGATKPSGPVEEAVPMIRGRAFKAIPFQFVNPYDLEPAVEKPPMYDLCMVNLAHYRNSADYEHTLYLTAQPTPCFSGVSEAEEKRITSLGCGAFYGFRSPDAKGWMLEFEGRGAAAQRQAMIDKEGRMAVLGARMIREQKRAAETAEKARLDSQDDTSVVMAVVRTAQDAFTRVLRTLAEWAGGNPEEVKVTFNDEFIETRWTPAEILQLTAAWTQGAFSEEVYWWNLQRGGTVPPNRTLEEDKAARQDEGSVRYTPVRDDRADEDDEEDMRGDSAGEAV